MLKLRESFESQGNEGASVVRGCGSYMESEDDFVLIPDLKLAQDPIEVKLTPGQVKVIRPWPVVTAESSRTHASPC